jgi:hypothetical protein
MKITGANAHVFYDSFDESQVIEGDGVKTTDAGKWYFIFEKGENSNLPYAGSILKAPADGQEQIILVSGDQLYPINQERYCKTSLSLSMEEGTVDVSDDCDPGANILDGIPQISGSLSGLFRYNDVTQEFDNVTDDIINRFMDSVEDNGEGIYETKERSNGLAYLLICLNSNAKPGQIENWLFIPAIISSASITLGNTDPQSKDLSFSKGEGKAVHYKVPKAA